MTLTESFGTLASRCVAPGGNAGSVPLRRCAPRGLARREQESLEFAPRRPARTSKAVHSTYPGGQFSNPIRKQSSNEVPLGSVPRTSARRFLARLPQAYRFGERTSTARRSGPLKSLQKQSYSRDRLQEAGDWDRPQGRGRAHRLRNCSFFLHGEKRRITDTMGTANVRITCKTFWISNGHVRRLATVLHVSICVQSWSSHAAFAA